MTTSAISLGLPENVEIGNIKDHGESDIEILGEPYRARIFTIKFATELPEGTVQIDGVFRKIYDGILVAIKKSFPDVDVTRVYEFNVHESGATVTFSLW